MLFYMIFPAIAAGGAVVMDIQRAKVDNAWLLFCLVISLTVQLMERGTGGFIAWSFGACIPFWYLAGCFYSECWALATSSFSVLWEAYWDRGQFLDALRIPF